MAPGEELRWAAQALSGGNGIDQSGTNKDAPRPALANRAASSAVCCPAHRDASLLAPAFHRIGSLPRLLCGPLVVGGR